MGAKAPEKLKLQRQGCKCEVCGRKFLNVQALTSHRNSVHKTKAVPAKRVSFRKETEAKQAKAVTRKVSSQSDSKKPGQMPKSKAANKSVSKVLNTVSAVKKGSTGKKIEFKCPKCVKIFSVYFSAYRHIQKNHCVNNNDIPVPPNSANLIKPIRLELCIPCNKWIPPTESHTCESESSMDHLSECYMCLGCQQTFDNLVLFEKHVKPMHENNAEYFFFPSKSEFSTWTTEVESVTQIKFVTLTPKQNSEQIYHCSHQPALKTDKTLLCPSSLYVTEFNNGYQVVYYKEHFGHTCPEVPAEKYKKYSINPFLADSVSIQDVQKDDTVYQQFKNIMNSITVNAAKANIEVLNTLLGKALEMTIVLNSIEKDSEEATVNKNMTDEQISDVLAEVKTYPAKRKADTVKKDTKKPKTLTENDENKSKNDTLPSKTPNKSVKKPGESLPPTPLAKPFTQSPSFNDTYKDFVDQNFKAIIPDTSTPKRSSVKKKVVMKTKIGQFKVKPSLSPKTPNKQTPPVSPKTPKQTPVKSLEYKIKPDIKYEVKEQENDCNILILKI